LVLLLLSSDADNDDACHVAIQIMASALKQDPASSIKHLLHMAGWQKTILLPTTAVGVGCFSLRLFVMLPKMTAGSRPGTQLRLQRFAAFNC